MRLLIVDDHIAVAESLHALLSREPGFELTPIAPDAETALRIVRETEPDVVLMDLGSPSRDTLEEMLAVSRALARPIAMFVDQSDDAMIGAAIDVTSRKEDEAHLRLVMRELTHRSKNLLAVIQAMARQTARRSASLDDFQEQFQGRLGTLLQFRQFPAQGLGLTLGRLGLGA